jgi:hypothetical protein
MVVAVASEALAKQSRGKAELNGKIILSASEIAEDWRAKPEKGERVDPVNPLTGIRPRMARERVGGLMAEAIEHNLIRAKPLVVQRKHANGSTYKATDWVIDPVESLATMLNPWISYRAGDPKVRKPRTIAKPCPECGEVHPVQRQDTCMGCGAILDTKIIAPVQSEETTESASDKSSEATDNGYASPPRGPVRNGRSFIGGEQNGARGTQNLDFDDLSEVDDGLSAPSLTDAREVLDDASQSPSGGVPPTPRATDIPSDNLSEVNMSPDDDGIDAPLLSEVQEVLASADRGDDQACQELDVLLTSITAQRGGTPVPKPRQDAFVPLPTGEAGDDWHTW